MDILEISETRNMSREEAARLLHKIADQLARHNQLEFKRDGINFQINVPNQVEVELELEIESDKCSFEIEINW